MARFAGDFTFGGQLFEAYWNMFVSSLRPVMYIALGTALLGGGSVAWRHLRSDDFYYLTMAAFARAWNAIGLNPDKLVNLRGYGSRIGVRMRNVDMFEPLKESLDRWQYLAEMTGLWFVFGIGVALLIYPLVAVRFARSQRKRTNQRGAFLTTAADLRKMVEDDNAARQERERKKGEPVRPRPIDRLMRAVGLFGRRTASAGVAIVEVSEEELKSLANPTQQDEGAASKLPYAPYTIAGIPFPWRHETTHFFAMGTTGSGKSTVLKDLLAQARTRGDRAVVFDLTGSFVETFYESGRDILLNPLDVRCPRWSIFNECADRVQLHSAARALIPSDGGRSDPFWIDAARLLLVEACLKLIQEKKTTNADLYNEIMTSVLGDLHRKLMGTVAGPLTEPEAKRMAESIRAVLNANAQALRLLPRTGEAFSIRDWVQKDDGRGGFLFIGCKTTNLDTLRSLLTLWYDTAIHALMDLPAKADALRMWFLFDELGALHRLPSLEDGMRTSRNFGGAFALGIHTIQQLWSVYGQHEGDTIASLGRTQLYLAQPDYRSAEWCSQMIGKTEYRESERSTTVGVERIRDGVGWTQRTEYRAIALAEQIMNLPSLVGYLKFPEGYPAALVEVPYVSYPQRAQGFVRRKDLEEPTTLRRSPPPPIPATDSDGSDNEPGVREPEGPAAPGGPGVTASSAQANAPSRTNRRGKVAVQKGKSEPKDAQKPAKGNGRSPSTRRKAEAEQEKETKPGQKAGKAPKADKAAEATPKTQPVQEPQKSEGPALERRHGLEIASDKGDFGYGDD